MEIELNKSGCETTCDDVAPLIPLAENSNETGAAETKSDVRWVSAFTAMICATLLAATVFGSMAYAVLKDVSLISVDLLSLFLVNTYTTNGRGYLGHPIRNVSLGAAVVTTLWGILAGITVYTLIYSGRRVLRALFCFFTGVWIPMTIVLTIVLAIEVSALAAIVPAIVSFTLVSFAYAKRGALHFAVANLKVAALALKAMPGAVIFALCMGVVQFLWTGVATIAIVGFYAVFEKVTAPTGRTYPAFGCFNFSVSRHSEASPNDGEYRDDYCLCDERTIANELCDYTGLSLPLVILWLLIVVWGCNVIHKVVACTVSASVASWWFEPRKNAAPVRAVLHRVTRSSFGSLCKAASILEARYYLASLVDQVLRCTPCGRCAKRSAETALSHVLAYTVPFIGIYKLNSEEAGQRVREKFEERDLSTIATNVTAHSAFGMMKLTALMWYAFASFATVRILFSDDEGATYIRFKVDRGVLVNLEYWSIMGPQVVGALVYVFLISTVVEVVLAACKATFVCFVQDSEAFARNHGPDLYQELNAAWANRRRSHGDRHGNNGARPQVDGQLNRLQ